MRIISKFHDYYDSALKEGVDLEVIYQRESLEVKVTTAENEVFPRAQSSYHSHDFVNDKKERVSIEYFYLGFCGKIYPVVKMKVVPWSHGPEENHFFYSYEDLELEISKHLVLREKSRYRFRFSSNWDSQQASDYKEFFAQTQFSGLENKFNELNVPLFLYEQKPQSHECKIVTNPTLKHLKFFKVKQPYVAFQEIYAFVAGVLNQPERKMVILDDKMKISKHGFDKWSFRRHKDQK